MMATLVTGQAVLQAVHQQAAIGQAGQGVVIGQGMDGLLGLPEGREVCGDTAHGVDVAPLVAQRHLDSEFGAFPSLIGKPIGFFLDPLFAGLKDVLVNRAESGGRFRVKKVLVSAPDQVIGIRVEDAQRCPIGVLVTALPVLDENAGSYPVEDGVELITAGTQVGRDPAHLTPEPETDPESQQGQPECTPQHPEDLYRHLVTNVCGPGPPPQGVEIDRIRVGLPASHLGVDGGQHVCMPTTRGGHKQLSGLKNDRAADQAALNGLLIAVKAIGGSGIDFAALQHLKPSDQAIDHHPARFHTEGAQSIPEELLLYRALQNGNGASVQVQKRGDRLPGLHIQLRPAVKNGGLVKVKTLLPISGPGDIGHEIQLSALQHLQAARPVAAHRLQQPPLLSRPSLQQIGPDTGCLPVAIPENLGRIVIHPVPECGRCPCRSNGAPEDAHAHQQAQERNHGVFVPHPE